MDLEDLVVDILQGLTTAWNDVEETRLQLEQLDLDEHAVAHAEDREPEHDPLLEELIGRLGVICAEFTEALATLTAVAHRRLARDRAGVAS